MTNSLRPARTSTLARFAILLAALWFAAAAGASVRKVAPGESVSLAAGEALLLVAVDTTVELRSARVKRDGSVFDAGAIRSIGAGVTAQLYTVPVGRYRWESVTDSKHVFELAKDDEYSFEVKAGVVNYPGHIVYRPLSDYRSLVHVSNRGLLALDWLDATHPALAGNFTFNYTGHYPDPFPEFYRAAQSESKDVAGAKSAKPPAAGRLPLAIAELWRNSRVGDVDVNPAGDLLALVINEISEGVTTWHVDVVDLAAGTAERVLTSPKAITRIDWSGSRALVTTIDSSERADSIFIVQVRPGPDGNHAYERFFIPRGGLLVDALPNEPDALLFATLSTQQREASMQVYRVDIRSEKAVRAVRFRDRDALDAGVENDFAWFTDGQGRLRAALALVDDKTVLMYGGDGKFEQVLSFEDVEAFTPFALSADGEKIYGWSEEGREQRDLVAFDPRTRTIEKTLFSRSGVDVQGALFDARRELIGASYYDGGQLISHYFDAASQKVYQSLQAAFAGKSVAILDRDAAATQFIVLVGASDAPSSIYHYDANARAATLIEETRPWLKAKAFVPAHVVKATSKDGLEIESYLTLPSTSGAKVPLIVFPHGGPIGIRDSRYFDPEVQFLASLGYAVLQVNFRGSEGYGSAFRVAGRKNYGTLIEDDIDAALGAALERYPLDSSRMCAMGASYGGYSALVSAVRWPERFKCAISMSGISEQALFFTASDTGRSKEGRKKLEEAIGDPREGLAEMKKNSPLSHVDRLSVPVMLVHGTDDFRVDYEHTRRLQRMLNLAGKTPVVLTLEQEGHGIEKAWNQALVWEGVAGFLKQALGENL